MTSVKIPKGHSIHVCSYASTTLTTAATDLTIEATVLPPVRVKLATVSKVDGSLRPCKQEPSNFIRGELAKRYGGDDLYFLVNTGAAQESDKGDITIEVQPWLAWWRTGNETRYCEINGAIEDFVPCVRVAVDTIGPKDYHTMGATAGGEYVEIPRLDVLGVTYEALSFVSSSSRHHTRWLRAWQRHSVAACGLGPRTRSANKRRATRASTTAIRGPDTGRRLESQSVGPPPIPITLPPRPAPR